MERESHGIAYHTAKCIPNPHSRTGPFLSPSLDHNLHFFVLWLQPVLAPHFIFLKLSLFFLQSNLVLSVSISELHSGTQHGFRQMIIPLPPTHTLPPSFRNHPLSKRKQVVKIIIHVFCLSPAAFPATLHRGGNCGFSQSVT